jgi:mannose-6-phosphate isomerase-like protein (cupin superfamily)
MYILSKEKVLPFVSQHGEIIYELIGRAVGEVTERHSLAYVTIPSGKSSLLHYHPHAEESYYILKGKGRILLEDEDTIVLPGQAILIPSPKSHKIINIGESDLVFLAFCVPAWEPNNTEFLEEFRA